MNRCFYFLKEALRGFMQGKVMTAISIMTISVALFFLGVLIIAHINFDQLLDRASGQAAVVAYLDEKISSDSAALSDLRKGIGAMPEVEAVAYIDKSEAWQRFESTYGSRMLEAIDDNPFPASMEAVLKPSYRSVRTVEEVGKRLEQHAGIAGVTYSQAWLANLERIRRYFLGGAIALFVVTAIALKFMIENTVKLTIYARRELVVNMRYVGASDAYIQMPFIIEGMLQGLVGAAAAFVFLMAAKLALSQVPVFWGRPSMLLTVLLWVGVLFGWSGSRSAVRKFLV